MSRKLALSASVLALAGSLQSLRRNDANSERPLGGRASRFRRCIG